MSTINKLIRGSIWNGVSQFGAQLFNMAITVVIARILSPGDFGVYGMVVVVTAFVGYFSEFGLTAGLIQKREIDSLDTNSVFWTAVVFSFSLFGIMYFGAPLVSMFYHEPRLTLITRVVFINFLIMPLNFLPSALETKKIEYGKITISELVSIIVSGTATVILALLKFGVWSLVWQDIIKTAVRAVVLIFLTRWKPKLEYSWKRIKPLLGLGVDYTINNLLLFAYENTDYLLVGKLLGQSPLGMYTMSFRLSKAPVLKIEGIFGKMLFPAFASFNDDPDRIRRNFLRLVTFFLTWITPILIFGLFATEPIIHILLGEKWYATIPLIRIFMIYLIFSSFCIQNNAILIAINKVKIWNIVQLISTAALAVTGFIGIRYLGILGMAIAFTSITSCALMLVFIMLIRLLGIPLRDALRAFLPLVIKNAVIAVAIAAIYKLMGLWVRNDWLLIIVPTFLLVAIMFALNKREFLGALGKIRNYVTTKKSAGEQENEHGS